MKQRMMALLFLMCICIGGCAGSLPPHEGLNQALTKTFDTHGFNYTSKSRVTDLSIPKQDGDAPAEKNLKYLLAGLNIVRGFSVNLDGAVDMKTRKSEVLYDLHYNRDNVEISVKVPLLFDYNTQSFYIGTSFLTTVLDLISPQNPDIRGKLIKLNFGELLRDSAKSKPELSGLIDEERFNSKNIDLFNSAFKAGLLESVAKLDDARFSDQPFTEQDKKDGVARRIQVTLGHGDSVTVVLNIIESVAQSLFREGVISDSEHASLLALINRQMLNQ